MNIAAIDPGKIGALTIFHNKKVHQYIIPLIQGTDQIDERALWNIIGQWAGCDCHVFIEDVHALYGASAGATFTFGFVCGLLRGMVIATGLPYTLVQPKTWQKEMFMSVKEIRKPSKKLTAAQIALGKKPRKGIIDTKAMALIAVKRLFPQQTFLATERSKKPHDGLIDSLLLAEYGRRLLGNS